jgi:diadenylate cyclase
MALPRGFRVTDVLDILVLAVVLYRAFLLFREARAIQLLFGLAGLMVASFAARWLDLTGTTWLLDHFWSFWVLALLVLFQPELRRALYRLGQTPILRGVARAPAEDDSRVLIDVVKAAEALAAKRIGALIVLERTSPLRQYAELGVPLDAVVSADLLLSLFLPYSPLHDGAAIVRGNRVVAAGCFLPLSRSAQLGRALGTRHRAALGLTEETDAVVVVVSEESGRISLAVHGHLESPGDRATLERRLLDLGTQEEAAAQRRLAWWMPAREWLRK